MRALSPSFMHALGAGFLETLTARVNADRTLCLELRGGYVNVYYRGGSLLRVTVGPSGFGVFFDTKYFMGTDVPLPEAAVTNASELAAWLKMLPELKQAIDLFQGAHPKDEREFQQLIVRDNNFGGVARKTDYYMCDIEYAADQGRFDMIGVNWPSTSTDRKCARHRRLVLVEVKHGDGALRGTAGIHAHVSGVNAFLSDSANVERLKEDMVHVFNQKRALGQIDCGKDLESFSDETPILLLLLANHDPGSGVLSELLADLPPSPHADVCIATASMMGYGIYDANVFPADQASGLTPNLRRPTGS